MHYFTADLHFNHANILKYDNRPFGSVEEMNQTLVKNWNDTVTDQDDVWIIGDIGMGNVYDTLPYLEQLKGKKHLIVGNHDCRAIRYPEFTKHFESIANYKVLNLKNKKLILFHYPIAEWDGYYHGSILIYGHIHSSVTEVTHFMKTRPNAYNAGCMINNYRPVTLEELIENNKKFLDSIGE